MLKNLKIGSRLWIWIITVILLFLFAGIITYSRIVDLEKEFEEVKGESEKMHLVMSLSLAINKVLIPPNSYLIPGADPDEMWIFIRLDKDVEEKFNLIEKYSGNHPDEQAIFKSARSNYLKFKQSALMIFDTFSYEDFRLEDTGILFGEMEKFNDKALLDLENWRKFVNREILGATEKFEKAQQEIFLVIIIIIALITLISTILGIIIIRSITVPVKELVLITKAIADGNLNKRVVMNSKDEIGQLAISFNKMIDEIKKSRSDVDRKVKQQTRSITQQKTELENQQKKILKILKEVRKGRHKADMDKDKIDKILHSIGDGVFVVDSKFKIIICNDVAADISGFTCDELLGKRYDEVLKFVYEDSGKVNDKFMNEAMKTGKVREIGNHTVIIRKDGSKVPIADSAAPFKDKKGNVSGCVVVFRDVAKEREINRAKSEFVSLASHQLRTPLSAINWYSEMLMAGDAGKLTKNQKIYLNEIYAGNQRMVGLVNALLNVSRIELGTFSIEPEKVKLAEICNSVLKELAPKIKEKKLKIKKNYKKTFPAINLDPKLMRIVFQNFLSNAVKYTPDKGKICVGIEKKKSDIFITISDTGYGIPKKQQLKVFSKLFRADNVREKETDGTGLGLYIVKAVIVQSGGKVWFESEEDKGTTFYVTLPAAGMKKKKGTKGLTAG